MKPKGHCLSLKSKHVYSVGPGVRRILRDQLRISCRSAFVWDPHKKYILISKAAVPRPRWQLVQSLFWSICFGFRNCKKCLGF